MLRVVDKFWMDHIDAMNTLRNEIGVLAYGQKDPIIAYKNEGFDMFDNMIDQIREYTASHLFRLKIRIDIKVPQRAPIPTNSQANQEAPTAPQSKGPFMPANTSKSPQEMLNALVEVAKNIKIVAEKKVNQHIKTPRKILWCFFDKFRQYL